MTQQKPSKSQIRQIFINRSYLVTSEAQQQLVEISCLLTTLRDACNGKENYAHAVLVEHIKEQVMQVARELEDFEQELFPCVEVAGE